MDSPKSRLLVKFMRKISISLILFIITVIFAGCQGQVPSHLSSLLSDEAEAPAVASNGIGMGEEESSRVKPLDPDPNPPVNYYPEIGLSDATGAGVVLTDKLKMKLYLIDKYKPGSCLGQPSEMSAEEIAGYLRQNYPLAQFARQHYGISSDLEVYSKVKQIMAISLQRGSGGKYLYRFIDGQCCDLITLEGEIEIINANIFETLLKHNSKKISC